MTAPDPEGKGGARAMQMAIDTAGLKPEDVDYINAHGTSTLLNDKLETMAIKRVFKDQAKKVMISSTKSMTGHLVGAAGAVEMIACAMAIKDGIIPPTVNYKFPDPDCDLDYVPNEARKHDVKVALSNSLGFGGHNCTVLAKNSNEESVMNYFLTEEQQMIKDVARQIAEEKIVPVRAHYDETQEFPWDLVKIMAESDLFRLYIEEEYGGLGGGVFELTLAVEELSKACGGIALALAATGLGTYPIILGGNESQKKNFYLRLLTAPI